MFRFFSSPLVISHLTIFWALVLSSAPRSGTKLFDARFYISRNEYKLSAYSKHIKDPLQSVSLINSG
jgi:hypothetical protein